MKTRMRRRQRKGFANRLLLFVFLPMLILAAWGLEWFNREILMKQQRISRLLDNLFLYLAVPLLLLFAWSYSHASAMTTVVQISEAAEAAALQVVQQPGVSANVKARIDQRVSMPACDRQLESNIHSQTASAMSVAISCSTPQSWTLYVPVRVEREASVLVLASNVSAGTVLDASHLVLRQRDIGQLAYGYLVDAQQVIGYSVRRPLQAGWALSGNDIEAPQVIKRGDSVTLIARSGPVEVRAGGKALSNAGVAERIRVENLSTRRVVDGTVTAEGMVAVGQ